MQTLFTQQLIAAYMRGSFPMGLDGKGRAIEWVTPNIRGLIPIGGIHCSRSLRKEIKRSNCLVSFDKAFADVITNCANRDVTWINQTICHEYGILHSKGLAHSVEIWKNGNLVGGLYGLALGAVFFAESMFSKISNASKLAMIAMMGKITYGGYEIFDTQFPNSHLKSLGGITVDQMTFRTMLSLSIQKKSDFNRSPKLSTWDEFVHYGCSTSS